MRTYIHLCVYVYIHIYIYIYIYMPKYLYAFLPPGKKVYYFELRLRFCCVIIIFISIFFF